jgi:UTP--glucose-1-phosphate uridylyltransferase
MGNFTPFEQKMTAAGMGDAAIRAFRRNYEALLRNETGLIPEETIEPGRKPRVARKHRRPFPRTQRLLAQAVVIKLNGGLGTSMGLQGPKSLLAVRDGINFLDLMVRQILDLRKTSGAPVRLLLMNSFSTSGDTLDHLQRYASDGLADASEVELMQNQIPKIDANTLEPVSWPPDPTLEWCPPGHGDLYPALVGSGWLDRLLAEGVKYAFVSNSDNLGAVLDPVILKYSRTPARRSSWRSPAAPPPTARAATSPAAWPTAACCSARSPNARMPISTPSRTSTATSISTPTACGCGSICSKRSSPPTPACCRCR